MKKCEFAKESPLINNKVETRKLKAGIDFQIFPTHYKPDSLSTQFLESCAYLFWIFCLLFNLCCLQILIVYSVIFVPLSRPLIALYIAWMIYDQKSAITGRRWPWFVNYARYNPLWDNLSAYFKGQLVKTAELDPSRKYIFGYAPHGVYSMGLFANVVFSTHFLKLFPGIETLTCTLPANFWFPGWREVALAMGCASCEAPSLRHRIRNGPPGTAMVIVIGGAEEFRYMKEGTLDLVLLKRKGFVKIALTTGADLVPIIGFGENEIFHQVTHPFFQPLHSFFQWTMKCSAPLFVGNEWVVFPKRQKLVTVGI
jgi:2-acylglycerol O-acyltransferase 2